jgi:hypothetical protein
MEGSELVGCRADVGCDYPTTATFGSTEVVWVYRSPIAEKFALMICEEIERCHVGIGNCVIIGQSGPKVTTLQNDGKSWHILAGKVRSTADRLVPASAGNSPVHKNG